MAGIGDEFPRLSDRLSAAEEGTGPGVTIVCLISLVAARRQICAVMTKETAGMFALEKLIR